METLERFLQMPVTLGINVVVNLWSLVPFKGLWNYIPGRSLNERAKRVVRRTPLFGNALSSLQ